MGKITTYMLIMAGITLLFYFGGLLTECVGDEYCTGTTPNSIILTSILKVGDLYNSDDHTSPVPSNKNIYIAIAVAIGAMAVVSVGLGIISRSPEWAALAPMALFLVLFGWDFLTIFSVIYAENQALALLISPIFVVWLLAVFEWFRGMTT